MTLKLSLLAAALLALSTAACADDALEVRPSEPAFAAYPTCGSDTLTRLDVIGPDVTEHAPLGDRPVVDPLRPDVTEHAPLGDLLVDPLRPDVTEAALDDATAMCACADDDCVIDWIDDTFGCGVCASTVCGTEVIGACLACDPGALAGATACMIPDVETAALD